MADLSPDDLGVLDPPRIQVELASGGVLVLAPIRVRDLLAFVRALGPIREAMAAPDPDLWQIIADHGERITTALALACGVPAAVIEGLEPGEYMDAMDAMLRANQRFFLSWLHRPILRAALQSQASPEDGPT
jgi:hypothetical protein